MAININYNPDIGAAGNVAASAGQYQARQQAFANQMQMENHRLRMRQLAEQSRQFDDNLNFQDRSQRRSIAAADDQLQKRASYNAASQRRSFVGNQLSQMQSQDDRLQALAVQENSRVRLGNIAHQQNLALTQKRADLDQIERKQKAESDQELLTYRDELTNQRMVAVQDQKTRGYDNWLRLALSDENLTDAEKQQYKLRHSALVNNVGLQFIPDSDQNPDGRREGDIFSEKAGENQLWFQMQNGRPTQLDIPAKAPSPVFNSLDGSVQIGEKTIVPAINTKMWDSAMPQRQDFLVHVKDKKGEDTGTVDQAATNKAHAEGIHSYMEVVNGLYNLELESRSKRFEDEKKAIIDNQNLDNKELDRKALELGGEGSQSQPVAQADEQHPYVQNLEQLQAHISAGNQNLQLTEDFRNWLIHPTEPSSPHLTEVFNDETFHSLEDGEWYVNAHTGLLTQKKAGEGREAQPPFYSVDQMRVAQEKFDKIQAAIENLKTN
jgi:hypothetical protein